MIIPIIVAAGAIGLVYALKGTTVVHAGTLDKQLPSPQLALPEDSGKEGGCTAGEKQFITAVVVAIQSGKATLALMQKAHVIALRCFPETAASIKSQIDRTVAAARAKQVASSPSASPQQQLSAIISSPDASPSPIPSDPKSGESLWKMDTRKGRPMAIPQFGPVLDLFKRMQSIVGAKDDGRIGDETIVKFRNLMSSRGFKKFPQTSAQLAANVAKYITVLSQNIPATSVGVKGGKTNNAPFLGRD